MKFCVILSLTDSHVKRVFFSYDDIYGRCNRLLSYFHRDLLVALGPVLTIYILSCAHLSHLSLFRYKFWSCCKRRTCDFDEFQRQEGCTMGEHVWFKVCVAVTWTTPIYTYERLCVNLFMGGKWSHEVIRSNEFLADLILFHGSDLFLPANCLSVVCLSGVILALTNMFS